MKISPHPDWATRFRKPGTELRLINGYYYLYSVSTAWDKVTKTSKKITGKLLGKITEKDGFVESDKMKLRRKHSLESYNLAVREFGASDFIFTNYKDILEKLNNFFPDNWLEIACMAFFRLAYQSPIKNLQHYYEHSYLSVLNEKTKITDKKISAMLRYIGKNRKLSVEFMKSFSRIGDYVLIDMTNVITKSKHIDLAAVGYNSKREYDPQVNLMLIYSSTLNEPVYYRIVPGNIREVKSFELSLLESGINDAILIADKGFVSEKNIAGLDESALRYILPLRRNSTLIDYTPLAVESKRNMHGYFKFEDRYIWYHQKLHDKKNIIIYLDDKLKSEEETDYLDRVSSHPENYAIEEFKEKYVAMGTVTVITNITDMTAEDIFAAYKTRYKIEQMIDVMKNIVESDKTYMQDADALEGWFFVNYVALLFYFRIYKLLVNKKMLSKCSVKDLITFLTEIKKVKIDDTWHLAEINSKNQKLYDKLDIYIT